MKFPIDVVVIMAVAVVVYLFLLWPFIKHCLGLDVASQHTSTTTATARGPSEASSHITLTNVDTRSRRSGPTMTELRTEHELMRLWKSKASAVAENCSECVICLESFEDNSDDGDDCKVKVSRLCGHKFHADCINDWIRTKKEPVCPICRQYVRFEYINMMV